MQGIVWLVLLAICLLIEAATLGLVTIWFGGGALVAFVTTFITDNIAVQVIVFLLVSFLLLIFTRPVATRYINAKRTKTNVDSLIGRQGRVTEQIDNFKETGTVALNGLEWTARAENDAVIEVGEAVIVKRIAGVKVFVETESKEK